MKECTALILIDADGNFVIIDADEDIDPTEKFQECNGDPTHPTRLVRCTVMVPLPRIISIKATAPEENITVEVK
jgi:hypothetical protein